MRTLSLFSSQRSAWKAHCFVNLGVAEQAVPPLQTPPLLLNLLLHTFTMASIEETLSVSRAFLCSVCCARQLQNVMHSVNGRQHYKRHTAMLYRVCFHLCSQLEGWIDCSCLTAQLTDKLLESQVSLDVWTTLSCRNSSQVTCLVNQLFQSWGGIFRWYAVRMDTFGSQ